MEQWRTVFGYPDYEVSDHGRVRRATPARRTRKGYVLKPWVNHKGYALIACYPAPRKRVCLQVHRLVCRAFHGEPLGSQQAMHLDEDKANNRADNLRWGSGLENARMPQRRWHYDNMKPRRLPSA